MLGTRKGTPVQILQWFRLRWQVESRTGSVLIWGLNLSVNGLHGPFDLLCYMATRIKSLEHRRNVVIEEIV